MYHFVPFPSCVYVCACVCRFATTGKYKEGITDFQKALSIKNTHRNARKYLTETQVAYAQE